MRKLLAKPYPGDGPWRCENVALSTMALNERVGEGNAAIKEVQSKYFRDMLQHGDTESEGNFHWHAYLQARIYFLFNRNSAFFPGRLSDDAEKTITSMLWEWTSRVCRIDMVSPERDWWMWGSENHHIQLFGSLWASLQILASRPDYAERSLKDGHRVNEAAKAFNEYFKRFLSNRATRSLFVETGSPTYTKYSLSPLYNMADFASDPELARLAKSFLDVFWAQWAIEQIDGVRGGSRHRCYQGEEPSELSLGGGDGFAWFHFGLGTPASVHPGVITAATTFYQPDPIIADLATSTVKRGEYEIVNRILSRSAVTEKERVQHQYSNDPKDPLCQIQGPSIAAPEKPGVGRYTYCTPEFILGSSMVPCLPTGDWMAISDQNRWDWLTFGGNKRARIFVQTEKRSRGSVYNPYWSVQHKGSIIIQRLKNTADKAVGNRIWFDGTLKVIETNGCFFAEAPAAFAAVRVVQGATHWQPQKNGRWLICDNQFTPVLIEAVSKKRCKALGDFAAGFSKARIEQTGDSVSYTSEFYGGTLKLYTDYSRPPEINGQCVDYAPEMSVESPFLTSRYGGTEVELKGPDGTVRKYDFRVRPEKK